MIRGSIAGVRAENTACGTLDENLSPRRPTSVFLLNSLITVEE
jgi:hypothetical protein